MIIEYNRIINFFFNPFYNNEIYINTKDSSLSNAKILEKVKGYRLV